MVTRILQLKQNNSTIYAHEIRSELQKEFGKITENQQYIGPPIPSVSSINRILRTNAELSSESTSQLQSNVNSLQSNQLSSFYYPSLSNTFTSPSNLSSTTASLPSYSTSNKTNSTFSNLYDPFSAAGTATNLTSNGNKTNWPTTNSLSSSNSSFSSGYSSSYSSGSNSPVGSSGSSSPTTEFQSSYGFTPSTEPSASLSHYHLFNGLLNNTTKQSSLETATKSINNETPFNPFHSKSQTSLQQSTNLQAQSNSQNSIYYSLPTTSCASSTSKKRSRKYTSFNINEILRRSDEEDIDVEDIDDDE